MKLVEVVRGDASGPAYVELATNLMRSLGQDAGAVRVDAGVHRQPGGAAVLRRGPADARGAAWPTRRRSTRVLREGGGFPLGPLELTDLIGQDVNLAVGRSVWEQTFHDPRYAPTVWQQRLVDAGHLGRKAGRGVYAYDVSGRHARGAGAARPATRVRPLSRGPRRGIWPRATPSITRGGTC